MTKTSRAILRRHGRDFLLRAALLAALAGGLSAAAAPRSAPPRRPDSQVPFQPGAAQLVRETGPLCIDPIAAQEGDRLLRRMIESPLPQAWRRELLERDRELLTYLMRALLSDEEAVARAAADTLRAVSDRRELILSDGTNPGEIPAFGSPRERAAAYDRFAHWWARNSRDVGRWE